jgi:hypothetical protein
MADDEIMRLARNALRRKFPQIDRLERLQTLNGLTLVSVSRDNGVYDVCYEAICSPELMQFLKDNYMTAKSGMKPGLQVGGWYSPALEDHLKDERIIGQRGRTECAELWGAIKGLHTGIDFYVGRNAAKVRLIAYHP